MSEQWKPIKGYEGYYEVSNLGRVRSVTRLTNHRRGRRRWEGRVLATYRGPKKYRSCCLWGPTGKAWSVRVHALVANAFLLPKPSPKAEVNHIDGVKHHCAASNLEWLTTSGNAIHAYVTGLQSKRALTTGQVKKIKRAFQKPYHGLCADLASRFGVSIVTIYAIRDGRTWGHVKV